MMDDGKGSGGALSVQKGIAQPPSVNPEVLRNLGNRRRKAYTADEFVEGIFSGDRTILSQAITLVESSLPRHYELAQEVIERCLPASSRSIRVGITGVPGAGKSTFIDTFGTMLTHHYGRRLAVLAIDPSSQHSHGSIMGDKTRMERLSTDPTHSSALHPRLAPWEEWHARLTSQPYCAKQPGLIPYLLRQWEWGSQKQRHIPWSTFSWS